MQNQARLPRHEPPERVSSGLRELQPSSPLFQQTPSVDAAIAWEQALGSLPSTMIILAEEGPAVVAKLRFKTCTAAARSKPPSRTEPKTDDSQQDGREAPPPKALPRGAIQ